MHKKTHEEFLKDVVKIHKNKYTILEEYKDNKTKILVKCNICGYVWRITPNSLLRNKSCPKCAGKIKKTHEQFVEEIKEKYNDKYIILGKYINDRTKILVKCNICGHEWEITPNNLLRGHGCAKCANRNNGDKKRAKYNEVIEMLKKYNLKICEGEVYKNNQTPIKCVDLDGYIVYIRLGNLQQGQGFSRFGNNNPSTIENIKHYIETRNDCKDIELVSDKFKKSDSKLTFKCSKHGLFDMTWANFYRGKRCPKCNQSKGESKIEQWLKENNIDYERQYAFEDCRHLSLLKFDFYLPNYNICIEYDGEQHKKPICFGGISEKEAIKEFKLTQERDKIKNEYCKTHNIPLLRIPYTEFDNIEIILESFLKEIKQNNNNLLTKSESMV